MTKNENKKVTVPADEAYGPYYSELVADIPKESAPEGLRVGDKVKLTK
jgi:FKBP-type peptidyl-prolyl cis-trans isomerase 2